MRNCMKKKRAVAIDIIGGADGPTSVFIVGRGKQTLSQRLRKKRFQMRKKRIEKQITEENHTMEEVCRYLTEACGFTELSREAREYRRQYESMRAALLMQHRPWLLGEYEKQPELESRDEAGIKKFMKENELREQAAAGVPRADFDIDLHIFEKKDGDARMHICLEKTFGGISGSCSGKKSRQRQFHKLYRRVYRYYGVTAEDIEKRTERYHALVLALAMK